MNGLKVGEPSLDNISNLSLFAWRNWKFVWRNTRSLLLVLLHIVLPELHFRKNLQENSPAYQVRKLKSADRFSH